jgi:DNA-binding NarL/FixJ family response regulator
MATETPALHNFSILLVDDQPAVRYGLRLLFQLESDHLTICEAGTGGEAIKMATSVHPDLIIMDVELPDRDGIVAAQQLISLDPHCLVIMLTIHNRSDVRARALAAGAWAFIEKQRPNDVRMVVREALGYLQRA